MQLKKLKRSRIAPRAGDIFVYSFGDDFGFGRVIVDDADMCGHPMILIYLYNVFSRDKKHTPVLRRAEMLTAPLWVMPSFWRAGYFETVEHRALRSDDVLKQHCFWDPGFHCYRDERGNVLSGRRRARGNYLIEFVNGVEFEVARALERESSKRGGRDAGSE